MLAFSSAVPASEALQEACGLPLGLLAQPLSRAAGAGQPAAVWAADLARCSRCLAYINALCEVDDHGWACSLCGCGNDFSTASGLRRYYGAGDARRAALPELQPGSQATDCVCPLVAADPDEGSEEVLALAAQPTVLALVDVCAGEEELELVKSALAAAVEALPPAARFGLLTFGSQVGLHTPDSRGELVAFVTLEGEEGSHADLAAAAHLGDVLTHLASSKPEVLAAIEGLQAEPPVGGGVERCLGDALRAVLRWVATGSADAAAQGLQQQAAWLQQQGQQDGGGGGNGVADAPQQQEWRAEEQAAAAEAAEDDGPPLPPASGFPGMRLLLFLAGPPNCGAGAVVARRVRAAPVDAAAAQAKAREMAKDMAFLTLDPVYPELSSWAENEAERRAAAQAAAAARAAAAADAAVASAGDLSHAAPPGVPGAELTANLAAAEFYAEAGAAAAALGISVDLFALAGPRWMGLDLLEPLVGASGGTALLYTCLEAAALPQDVYKAVSQPRAFACLARLRCSPELEVEDAHGRLAPDGEHADLWRLVACGPDDALAFDLARSGRRAACAAPAAQLVLQYSLLVPGAAPPGAPPGSCYELRRFMRVLTAAAPLAANPAALYASCDADAIAALAVHKCLLKAQEADTLAARQMLFDWLVLVTARVAELVGGRGAKVDASLGDVEALQQLPHMLYAVLRGPLLQLPPPPAAAQDTQQQQQQREQEQQEQRGGPAAWRHPDAGAALRGLVRQLPPDELAVAVCPQLSSWAGPDEAAQMHHSLSAAAFKVSTQPIWCLDAFSQLIVLYTAAAAASSAPSSGAGADDAAAGGGEPLPFPPPAASALRRTLAGIRQLRRCTPELLMLRQGTDDDTSAFDAWLIEDAAAGAAAAAPGRQQQPTAWPTFVSFLSAVNRQAQALLQ